MTTVSASYKVIVLWFAIVCLLLTAFLLIWPNAFMAANRFLKKWVATDSLEKKLNQTHDIDQQLMGLRKIMGFILLLLSVVFIVLLIR